MSPAMIRRKVEEEIAMIPDGTIAQLYKLIHDFRLRSRASGKAGRIMDLAGSWAEMPADEYVAFVSEIQDRRRRAGSHRRVRETGSH